VSEHGEGLRRNGKRRKEKNEEMAKNKVLLVGWDAADWKLIDKLMANGLMPAMKSLVENGVRGKLATLDPPLSPMLWTSMATGVRPYKHGVIGFVEHDGKGGVRGVSSHYRKVKAVWNMFTMEGIRSNVVAWWPSNPVESINGCMVSNLFHQEKRGKETVDIDKWDIPDGSLFPETLSEKLKDLRVHPSEITGNLVMPFVPQAVKLDKKQDKRLTVISKFLAHATTVHSVCTELMETEEWDFTAVYHDALDHFSHAFMKYHPPRMEGLDEEMFEMFKDVVLGAYVFHDMMLDRLLKMVDDDTTVVVVSDHGFHSDHLRPTHVPNVPSGPAIEHAPYGIFVAKGPGIKKGERVYGASVLDVTPTLLTLFDLPVGKDMDGKPLIDIFDHPRKVQYIDSWENVQKDGGEIVKVEQNDTEANDSALQQLVDLGYIDEVKLGGSTEETEAYLKGVLKENRFYLAKSFSSGGQFDDALEILLEIEDKAHPDFRFIMEIIQCAIKTHRYDLASEYLDFAEKKEIYSEAFVCSLRAKIELGRNEPDRAMAFMKKAFRLQPEAIDVLLDLGKLYNLTRSTEEARTCYLKVIEKDPDNPYAFHGVGLSYLREENYEEALEYFLQAIERLYHYPLAHLHLAETLALMKDYENAIQVFELTATMLPEMPKIFRWLVDLNELLGNEEKAGFYRKILTSKVKGEKLIITGFPGKRLDAIIIEFEKLGLRIDKTFASDKDLSMLEVNWIDNVSENAVYVPLHLITGLTAKYNYQFIFVIDEADEIATMIHENWGLHEPTYNKTLIDGLRELERKVMTWFGQQPDIDIVYLKESSDVNNEMLRKFFPI
jgi:predicted AlkP superfamily phosphohydrolase/phosphomutase/tetratricopeptide (TPR) repeat protein